MPALLPMFLLAAHAGDADHDGISNGKDTCRDAPETVNTWRDDDGCPDQLGVVEVLVLDLEGKQVEGAIARVGEAEGRTDASGRASFPGLLPDRVVPLAVDAPGFADWTDREAAIVEGTARVVATLDWLPVEVHVEARDTVQHRPIAALVRADGPGYVESQATDEYGGVVLGLRPGTWTLRVESPQHQTASRTLSVVANGVVEPAVVELRPAWLALADLDLSFTAGTHTIGPEREATVRKVAAAMFAFPALAFVVTGHGDLRAHDLSLDRAEGVRERLVAVGLDPARVSVVGLGDEDPLATPWLAAGRAANRSVVVLPGAVAVAPEPVVADPPVAEAGVADPIDVDALNAVGLRFAPGAVRPGDDAPILALAGLLGAHPTWTVLLVGRRDVSDHDPLGRRRAEAAVARLVAASVPPSRLTAAEGPDSPAGLTVAPAPEEAEVVALDLPFELYFRPGSDALLPESAAYLPEIAARLAAHRGANVRVLGHTLGDEPETAGASLSERRAEVVRQALAASGDLTIGAVGAALPSRVPPGAVGVGGYVSFVVLPPPLFVVPSFSFASDVAEIDPGGAAEVERLAAWLKDHPGVQVELQGHAGPAEAEPMARLRAQAVKGALLASGVERAQVWSVWTVDEGARVDVELVGIPIDLEVPFAAGSATLTAVGISALERALPAALAAPRQRLEIVGRAEAAETSGLPDALGRERAEGVARWLIAHGVAPTRLQTTGTRGTGTTIRVGG